MLVQQHAISSQWSWSDLRRQRMRRTGSPATWPGSALPGLGSNLPGRDPGGEWASPPRRLCEAGSIRAAGSYAGLTSGAGGFEVFAGGEDLLLDVASEVEDWELAELVAQQSDVFE